MMEVVHQKGEPVVMSFVASWMDLEISLGDVTIVKFIFKANYSPHKTKST